MRMKIVGYLIILLVLIVSVVAVTRNSYVDNQFSLHSLYNISNITVVDNIFGPLQAAAWKLINYSDEYALSGFKNENVSVGIDNGTIIRTSNLTTEGICRTGSGCNVTDLNVTGLLNISEGFKGGFEIATLHDLTAGNVTITTEIEVRNDEPVTLNRGDPVYFTSYISGLSLQGVEFANNTQISTHADCIIAETIAAGQRGQCVETGHVIQADTSEKVFGDDLYLDSGGNLTHDKPIHANCIQKIGMVLRSHASQGVIWVNGVDRCNDVPKDINITGNVTLNTLFGQWNGSADLISNLLVEDDVGWTNLTKYPAACASGFWISTLDDSVTCTKTPDIYAVIDGTNVTGNWNHTSGNYTISQGSHAVYGNNSEAHIYYNGSSLVIKVT